MVFSSHVRSKAAPKLRNPLLVVGFPGIGLVSKLATDHLVRSLKAKHFATLYSSHFPNQVLALKNGKLKMFSMRLYYSKLKKRDLVIARGDLQPLTVEGQYDVSNELAAFFKNLGGKHVISMAGFAVNKTLEKPTVYATATSKEMFDSFIKSGAKQSGLVVPIVGMAGLVPTVARLQGLEGACLLVETPGQTIDAKGAQRLLEVVGSFAGAKFDGKHLEKRAKRTQKLLDNVEQQAKHEEHQAVAGNAPVDKEIQFPKDLSYIR